jgi:hypothetical protein
VERGEDASVEIRLRRRDGDCVRSLTAVSGDGGRLPTAAYLLLLLVVVGDGRLQGL